MWLYGYASLSLGMLFESGKTASNPEDDFKFSEFFNWWSYKTVLVVFSNGLGGILTGLNLKYSGVVKNGFAIILALIKLALF